MSKGTDKQDVIVGLDIGTSKITVVIAELQLDGSLRFIASSNCESQGIEKGRVVKIDAVVKSISKALADAEMLATDYKITHVYAGISGNHIQSVNVEAKGSIKDGEVSPYDIAEVRSLALASVDLPSDKIILGYSPPDYAVDRSQGSGYVRDPLGMSGRLLEIRMHVIAGAISPIQNLMKCVHRCGIEIVEPLIFHPLASSEVVLTKDEKEQGVCLIDIGDGTTDVVIFKDGVVKHTFVLPIAGFQITGDIATKFGIRVQEAEKIKMEHGCALLRQIANNHSIEATGVDGYEKRLVSPQELSKVIQLRVTELYKFVQKELRQYQLESLITAGGIVITGGSASLHGMIDLAKEVFAMNVRLGIPHRVGNGFDMLENNSSHATILGLLLIGKRKLEYERNEESKLGWFRGLLRKLGQWRRSHL